MRIYTEEELNIENWEKSLLLALSILAVTIFIDVAPILQQSFVQENIEVFSLLKTTIVDFEVALITFVVSSYSSGLMTKETKMTYFIALSAVLGFVSLVLCKVFGNILWFLVLLTFSIATIFTLMAYYIAIIRFIKHNGRRLPC